MRQTHSHRHFEDYKHGQGNGAVAHMDDNRDRRGDQLVGIGYTTGGVEQIIWLVRVYRLQWRMKGQTHKRLADSREQGAEGMGEEGVEGEPMNIGYTAPQNVVYDRLVVVAEGRGERQWKP